MPREIEITGGRIESRGGAITAITVVGLVLILWLVAFLSGFAPWLGYKDKTYRNISAAQITVAGRSSSGIAIGPRTFPFLEGQEVFVDYDVELRRGALLISVFDLAEFEHVLWQTVTHSGSGTAALRIPRSGLYSISVEPSVVGGVGPGYDLDVSAVWGARWP